MPKVDLRTVTTRTGSSYPAEFAAPCAERHVARLGDAVGLTQFGVNLVTLPPGAWASQRHWHQWEDEFVYVLEGQLVLVEDDGEILLNPGDSAGWPAGVRDGHHLMNRADQDAKFLVVGTRDDRDHGEYPDIDMMSRPGRYSGKGGFCRKDGTPY